MYLRCRMSVKRARVYIYVIYKYEKLLKKASVKNYLYVYLKHRFEETRF